ncbi:MAG: hypothetical protein RRA35_12770 [Desulfomonilia bacterium]|nr:hypothetical protein [Desulfomonilia bacterium]
MEFEFDGKGFVVEEILDHWKEAYQNSSFYPQEYYKVQASDRQLYILRYSTLFRSWWAKRCGVNQ